MMDPDIAAAMEPDPSDRYDIPSADPAWDALNEDATDGVYDEFIDVGPEPRPSLDYEPDDGWIEAAS